MSHSHGFRNHPRRQHKTKEQPATNEVEETNPVLKAFRVLAHELDNKHDRQERIVKLSRDITIESKRIIFLLHTIDGRKNNKASVLEEAEQRLEKVIAVNFKAIAKELDGQDPYQFRYSYSPGLQEFIEAYSFMEYYKSTDDNGRDSKMSDWNALQEKMHFVEEVKKDEPKQSDKMSDLNALQEKMHFVEEVKQDELKQSDGKGEEQPNKEKSLEIELPPPKTFQFFVDPTEYILGLSDLTGELMRRCINSLGSGEVHTCLETCKALQQFYTGYIGLTVHRTRELSRKIYTMRQSVLKAENVCYNVKVRGGEAAKWGAVFDKPGDDVDEGFY